MSALVDNKTLLLRVKMPKQSFVLARICTDLVNFGYTCIAYVLMPLVFRVEPSWTMLLFPVPVFFLVLFAMGIGYFLSIFYVFFGDIRYLYSVLLTLWMYLSAIFYPVDQLPSVVAEIVSCNPVYVCINFARQIMMYQTVPDVMEWVKMILWGVGSFLFGYLFFKKNENSVMQKI
jgi:ABC-type polysaccharide/polyol phosphate export permease